MLSINDFKKFELSKKDDLNYIYAGALCSYISGSSDSSRIGQWDKENKDGTWSDTSQNSDSCMYNASANAS